jgi:hypothetical protein
MLMQNAIAKMIRKPCEANAGLEICISVFEPRSLPALAHYPARSNSPERLGGLPSFGPLIFDLLTCGLLPLLRAPCSPFLSDNRERCSWACAKSEDQPHFFPALVVQTRLV